MRHCQSCFTIRTMGWVLTACILSPNASAQALQLTETSQTPPALAQDTAESPSVTRWRTLSSERRTLQKTMGSKLTNMNMLVPEEQTRQLAEVEQIREQLIAMKFEMQMAAAEGFAEAPEKNILLGRDALNCLAVLMGEDDQIAAFNPSHAQILAGKIIAAGVTNPQFLHIALRAAVATQDFATARTYVAQLDTMGIKINQAYLDQLDALERGWQRELTFRERDATASLPVVRIETDRGVIVAELFEDDAPNTVNSFVSLVEREFYNDQEFFNVQPGFLALAGCPNDNGSGDAGYAIPDETASPTAREHFVGSLTTFHLPEKQTSCMYSLVLQPLSIRNGEFTVFGRVTEGVEILHQMPAFSQMDLQTTRKPVRILKVSMDRKRNHVYTPSLTIPLTTAAAASGSTGAGGSGTPPVGGGG